MEFLPSELIDIIVAHTNKNHRWRISRIDSSFRRVTLKITSPITDYWSLLEATTQADILAFIQAKIFIDQLPRRGILRDALIVAFSNFYRYDSRSILGSTGCLRVILNRGASINRYLAAPVIVDKELVSWLNDNYPGANWIETELETCNVLK